jgi:tetratricopeptide (TPR) repeat protein
MQTAASNILILTEFSSSMRLADLLQAISHGGLYQVIASSLTRGVYKGQVVRKLGDTLVALAEYSYAFRQVDALEQISWLLVNSPRLREYETIGCYYQALCVQKFGCGDVAEASRSLERVAESAQPRYRARAMQSLGSNSFHKGDHKSALSFYCEAARFASCNKIYDAYAGLGTHKMIAVISGEDGNHNGAVVLLEELFPLAQSMRRAQPHIYYDYLNSFAVELCAVGRLEQAKKVAENVVASPFAPAYPEWRETLDEIELRGRRASRSTVGFTHLEAIENAESSEAPGPSSGLAEFAADSLGVSHEAAEASNVLRFPVRELAVGSGAARIPSDTAEPARVLNMSERNNTMERGSNETPPAKKIYEDLDGRLLLLKIMELTAAPDITDYELLEILKSIESILSRAERSE